MTADEPITAADMRAGIQAVLDDFMAAQGALMLSVSPDLAPLSTAVGELLAGGKRLRAAFCIWSYVGFGGEDLLSAIRVGGALELVQACALIHDDVMDGSDIRRGKPAAHRRFATLHRGHGWLGSPDRFGDGAAILLGDLCLSWADELFYRSGFDAQALSRAKPIYDVMRTELMGGQYLDLLEQALGGGSAERALLVTRYKSAKYTVERPLHIGAALAGAGESDLAGLSDYGLPLGEAFQLRDDVLGVFGDPVATGKPAGDDLREGKRTLLVATAAQRATPAQAETLREGLGDTHLSADGIAALREVIVDTGALEHVEAVIAERSRQAERALGALPITESARQALGELIISATARRV